MVGSTDAPSQSREEEEEISRHIMHNVYQISGRGLIFFFIVMVTFFKPVYVSVAGLLSFGM